MHIQAEDFCISVEKEAQDTYKLVRQMLGQFGSQQIHLYEVLFVISDGDKIVDDDYLYIIAEKEQAAQDHAKFFVEALLEISKDKAKSMAETEMEATQDKAKSIIETINFTVSYEVTQMPLFINGWGNVKF